MLTSLLEPGSRPGLTSVSWTPALYAALAQPCQQQLMSAAAPPQPPQAECLNLPASAVSKRSRKTAVSEFSWCRWAVWECMGALLSCRSTQHGTARHGTARHIITSHHITSHHSTAQHSTAQPSDQDADLGDGHELPIQMNPAILQLRMLGHMPLQHLRSSGGRRSAYGNIGIIQVCHHMVPYKLQKIELAKVKGTQGQ